MDFTGLSDSLAEREGEPILCPVCRTAARINNGECLGCLLQAGIKEDDATDTGEGDFVSLLTEVDIRDTDWRLGNYQILEEIGRGGMGVIYRARQRHSRRIVALKRILSYHGNSEITLERFRREAEAAASLDHSNILPIFEVGEEEGLPFFTMKYATGGSLYRDASALRADTRACVELMVKVARGVAHAHEEGILHRDLKPGNILLDGRGEPLISDFGLAKWLDADNDLTRSLAIFGTPGFIAPEQAAGNREKLTAAADIYSLGAILFDLLSGRPPFLGEHALAVIRQAEDKPAPALRSLVPKAERDLETICAKCLEREPEARYRSASDLADDLQRWLDGRPIAARRLSLPAQGWRWCRRNRVLAAAAVLCAFVMVLAGVKQLSNWRLQRELSARLAAQHSLGILPFLDLDTARPAEDWTAQLDAEVRRQFQTFGPARVRLHRGASGASPVEERASLFGTRRMVNGRLRVVLFLRSARTDKLLRRRVIECTPELAPSFIAHQFSREAYEILSNADLSKLEDQTTDPGLSDPETRNFITVAKDLAARRDGVDLGRAVGCLRRAIELQPKCSIAHALLGKYLIFQSIYAGGRPSFESATEEAKTALALDPENVEGHIALAGVYNLQGRFSAAKEEALIAIETGQPSRVANLLSIITRGLGQLDRSFAWTQAAPVVESTPPAYDPAFADIWAYAGDDRRAESIYRHYLQLHPEQPEGWMGLCHLALLNRRFSEARAQYQAHWKGHADFSFPAQMAAQVEFFGRNFSEAEKLYAELYRQLPAGGDIFYGSVCYASALGRIRLEEDPRAARELLEEARSSARAALAFGSEDPRTFYTLAAAEACLGETSSALDHLSAAIDAGFIDYRSMEVDPRFDNVRQQGRYISFVQRVHERVSALHEKLLIVSKEAHNE